MELTHSRRFEKKQLRDPEWASHVADQIIADDPDAEVYTCAAGISPSGVVHFGNFRDVMTAHMVRKELVKKGKKARLLFSWDNFDRFRKVPVGIPESFEEHVGKALSSVPDPQAELGSYAERNQLAFVTGMERLGIEIDYRSQTDLYQSGEYDDQIIFALQNRDKIADVLLSFMSQKAIAAKQIDPEQYKTEYYPISVYSSFTGKDATKVLSYDGDSTITYFCKITKQEETINIREKRIVKLGWKVDWPMRWKHERVHFEPGGIDHASPGSSYDVGTVLCEKIFNYTPPVFVGYTFVGIQGLGAKMSGSKGNAVSPLDLLDIYEPELLLWLYERKAPNQSFELAFNTEIYRQYDEYDKEIGLETISFRNLVGLGQIVQWDGEKLLDILKQTEVVYDKESVQTRLSLAQSWLEKYNQDEMISFNKEKNNNYYEELPEYRKENIKKLQEGIKEAQDWTIADYEALTYAIPKKDEYDDQQKKQEQRVFFKDINQLLLGSDRGPRLGTFLWANDRKTLLELLTF